MVFNLTKIIDQAIFLVNTSLVSKPVLFSMREQSKSYLLNICIINIEAKITCRDLCESLEKGCVFLIKNKILLYN